jgi:hypothetical protein
VITCATAHLDTNRPGWPVGAPLHEAQKTVTFLNDFVSVLSESRRSLAESQI